MKGRARWKNQSGRGEVNYVRWILLLGVIVAAYFGWKVGPAYVKRFQLGEIANKCAAKMNTQFDNSAIIEDDLKPAFAEIGLDVYSDKVEIKFDRDVPTNKKCTIRYLYEGKHVWGSQISKWVEVTGASKI